MTARIRYAFVAALCLALGVAGAQEEEDQADPGWPREYKGDDGTTLVLYQPQVARRSTQYRSYRSSRGTRTTSYRRTSRGGSRGATAEEDAAAREGP